MHLTKGGITRQDILSMPYKEWKMFLKEASILADKMSGKNKNE